MDICGKWRGTQVGRPQSPNYRSIGDASDLRQDKGSSCGEAEVEALPCVQVPIYLAGIALLDSKP